MSLTLRSPAPSSGLLAPSKLQSAVGATLEGPAVGRVVQVAPPGGYAVLAVRQHRRFLTIPQTTITYCCSLGGVVTVYADAGRFWTDLTLGEIARRLDPRIFVRLDQSHMVNIARLAELVPETHQRYRLRFADIAQTEIVVSRDVGRRLRAVLGW